MICAYCGEDHSFIYCRKKPEGWKPPKKSTGAGLDPTIGRPEKVAVRRGRPPVDTSTVAENATVRKCGRPSTGFDKAAYNREYMRKRRAAEKEGSNAKAPTKGI